MFFGNGLRPFGVLQFICIFFAGFLVHADETSLTLTTTSGSNPASAATVSYTTTDAAFSVVDTGAPVSVSVTVQPHQLASPCTVTLRRSYDAPLSTGVFRAPATPLPPVPCTLDLEWGGFWILTDQLEIWEVAFDANGRLAALSCTFTAFSLWSSKLVRGELKFHAGSGVQPVNQRPGVTAGNPQRISIQTEVPLSGAAGDDGLPRGTALQTECRERTRSGDFRGCHAARDHGIVCRGGPLSAAVHRR